jgi:hypothetical protein
MPGRASSSRLITTSTTMKTITVTAHTQAASRNRYVRELQAGPLPSRSRPGGSAAVRPEDAQASSTSGTVR